MKDLYGRDPFETCAPDYYDSGDESLPFGGEPYDPPQIDERPDDERAPGDSARQMAHAGDRYSWTYA